MLLECVPNVSEGRCRPVIESLARVVMSVHEVYLLDTHTDPDHNRTVFTFAGGREPIVHGAFALIREAAEQLDISRHEGVHPRMGCVDVCPFVPLGSTPMADAVTAARSLADRVAAELAIPVYLYGEAAVRPDRRDLPRVRPPDLHTVAQAMARDPDGAPDRGPRRLHPRFGAIAIGARRPLVAFNVDLASDDLKQAKRIASRIREAGGGLPAVRALGLPLPARGVVQVSCNLLEGERTPPAHVLESVQGLASGAGIPIDRSELVGLMPRDVVYRTVLAGLKLPCFSRDNVLEDRLSDVLPLAPYLETVADPSGGPGGGSVSADVGALAASLGAFVASITAKGKPSSASPFQDLALRFLYLSRCDTVAYSELTAARNLPQGPDRDAGMATALRRACDVPLNVLETARAALTRAAEIDVRGSVGVDLRIVAHLLLAAARCARETVGVNLKAAGAAAFRAELTSRSDKLMQSIEKAAACMVG